MPRRFYTVLFILSCLWLTYSNLQGQTVWEWKPTTPPGSTAWSDLTANWTKVSGPGATINGSRLEWRGFGDPSSVNDLTGNTYQRLSFFGLQSYTLSGFSINLADGLPGGQGMVYSESPVTQTLSIPLTFTDLAKEGVITTQSIGRLGISTIVLGTGLPRLNIYGENLEGIISLTDNLVGDAPVVIGNFGNPKPNTRVVFLGDNSLFTGTLSVTGVLTAQNNLALGTSAISPAVVTNGSTIEISGGISLTGRNIAINGNGVSNAGALRNILGNNTILPQIFLLGNSRIGNDAFGTSLTLNKITKDPFSALSGITFNGTGNIILNDTLGTVVDSLNGNFVKSGTGILTVRRPCYYTGSTNIIGGGVILIAADNVLPLRAMTLNSGSFRAAVGTTSTGFSQNFRQLTLSQNSTILLGTGNHSVSFESSRGATWAAGRRLTIEGWRGSSGTSGVAGFGKVYFQSPDGGTTPGLTEAQLAQITFNGYCDGAALLADGELVPAVKPFIQNITSSDAPAAVSNFSSFVGATVTLTGCLFNNAFQVDIGTTQLKLTPTPQFTLVDSTRITFLLGDQVEGQVKVYTPLGERTNPTPLSNLGYITRTSTVPWINGNTWLGNAKPPADRPVSINHNNIEVDHVVDSIDFQAAPDKPLTLYGGNLKLGGSNRIPSNTPVTFFGGTLRCYNANSGTPPTNSTGNGFNQTFGTLSLRANSIIAFGNSTGPNHIIRFSKSDLIAWTPTARLTIQNWVGNVDTGGTKTKIFVGNDANSLTPDQLRQIAFGALCQGAKILPSGELVPAEAPFISNVVSDPASGTPFQAFIGSKVVVSGCKFDFVDPVAGLRIGTVNQPFTLVGPGTIEFIYPEGVPPDRIFLTTTEVPAKMGFSADLLSSAGYATGANGSWNEPTTWLSSITPKDTAKVTVRNQLKIDNVVALTMDTVIVVNGGSLILEDNGVLNIRRNLINRTGGIVTGAGNGRLNMRDGAMISDSAGTGNPGINMNGFGTVNFLGNGILVGSKQMTFHNLWINSGILTLPNTTPATIKTSLVPWITGEFRIYGGSILAANNNATFTYGPRYTASASLVYASGASQRRGREWFAAAADGNAAYPRNVLVDNGTSLILDAGTGATVTSPTMVCGGNFTITNGTVRADMAKPLEILGDLQIGENASSFAELNIGRLASEVDAVTPTTQHDNVNNYVIVRGNIKIFPNSSFNTRLNTRPFHFMGSGNMVFEIPGADPMSSTPALTLNNVNIEKNGFVTLKSSLAIATTINFSNGSIMKTDPGVFLRINAAATMTGGGPTNFVAGTIQKETTSTHPNASGNFTFHTGKLDGVNPIYKPVRISNLRHSGTSITTYSAEYKDSSTTVAPRSLTFLDAFLQGIWANEFWEVNKVSGAGKARVGIQYSPGNTWTTSPPGSANVGIVRWTGDSWEFTKGEDNFNDTTNAFPEFLPVAYGDTVYTDTIVNFSPFTIGWGDQNVLSLNLLYFNGAVAGNDVWLKWKLADNEDLSHFVVEHSTDGRNFTAMDKVLWQQNKEYTWKHAGPPPGIHFYRLRMVEKSGHKSFSRVEMVQLGVNKTIIGGLVQNPVQGGAVLLDIYSASNQKSEAVFYDMSGRLVLRQSFNLQAGRNQSRLSVFILPAGRYQMFIRTGDGAGKQLPLIKM